MLLRGSVEKWMSEIFGPIEIQVRPNNNAPPSIYFKRPGVRSEWTIASNTGFGLSYALPIIVAGLLAPERSVLIVDSPEAHLHPAAQTAIAKFLCAVAASGVKVIIETHSDYILDGIRIVVTARDHRLLSHESCTFLTLGVDRDGVRDLSHVKLRADGKPDKWPKGFFDQQLANLRAITDNVSGASQK